MSVKLRARTLLVKLHLNGIRARSRHTVGNRGTIRLKNDTGSC